MTQAFNLSQFANNLNSSGATTNTGLQNSAVTVTAGTGMSGGGSVALGSSVTLTNAGVTSLVAGTGISISGSTGAVTVTNTSSGGVTSAVAGNGVAVSGATGAVTFSASCPTFNTVGSYAFIRYLANSVTLNSGSNYGTGTSSLNSCVLLTGGCVGTDSQNNLSGTWKWMGSSTTNYPYPVAIGCRVS